MMNRKGMSQTLALIVAASVLMMTALTVIFLARGSLSELGQTSGRQACTNAIQSQCTATSANNIDLPGVCTTQGADGNQQIRSDVGSWASNNGYTISGSAPDWTVTCPGNTP